MEMSINSYGKRNWTDQDYLLSNYTQHYNDKQNHLSYCITDTFNQCSTLHDSNSTNNMDHVPTTTTSSSSSSSMSSSLSCQYQPPIKRVANERERTRTASVNDAFLMLRNLIPTQPINRKLSKIETLRLASSYISHLHAILVTGSGPADQPCLKHQQIYHLNATTNTTNNDHNSSSNDNLDKNQLIFNYNKPYRSVCTFCVTEMKQHQRILNKETILLSNGQ
ncbi:putative paraxis [Schistosoma mansoni]|uniref:Putative paraxis n=1 Tax=Schistosoma mansoni TaxID=6183 RepID=G4VSK8_SCHMA|nr:putative paraxis [Schistosoma mansoni]|eukprot:XP_018654441.1 putative paraxis [Schistosoma mansoni]